MLRKLIAVVFLGFFCGAALGDDPNEAPKEARTTADILKWVDSAKGFGFVASAEFRRGDTRRFLVWYNPYSGRAACHVHGYVFDAKKGQWQRQLDRVFQGTHDVSVELGAALTIRDVKGAVVHQEKAKD